MPVMVKLNRVESAADDGVTTFWTVSIASRGMITQSDGS